MTHLGREKFISGRMELALAAALLILGFAARLALSGSLPLGLNQDEASAGYDAWALLTGGIDRCGNRWPVLLESWGSGQNALLTYLAIPFIALMGLKPLALRLPMALVSCAALFCFWRLARRVRGPGFGLCALLLLAVCPWHIMASRWALESNLLPAMLLFGVYFTIRAREEPWALTPAFVFFGLSLYAYGTAFFFLPFYLVFALVWLGRRLRPVSLCASLAAFVLIALPITLCQLRNALGLPETTLLGLTLPALTESRQLSTSVFGGGGWEAVADNLREFLRLLILQTDGLIYNSLGLKGGGLLYFFGLPLAVCGLVRSLLDGGENPGEITVLAALCCCLPAVFLVSGNVNRLNMLWLPAVYFAALGLYDLCGALGRLRAVPIAAVLLCFCLFASSYVREFGGEGNCNYYPGLGDCIEYVEEREPESAFVSYYVNNPYVFVLFYTGTPVENYVETVDYVNADGAFRWVSSFGHWRFGRLEEASGEYLILHRSEAGDRPRLAAFGEYVVCPGKT